MPFLCISHSGTLSFQFSYRIVHLCVCAHWFGEYNQNEACERNWMERTTQEKNLNNFLIGFVKGILGSFLICQYHKRNYIRSGWIWAFHCLPLLPSFLHFLMLHGFVRSRLPKMFLLWSKLVWVCVVCQKHSTHAHKYRSLRINDAHQLNRFTEMKVWYKALSSTTKARQYNGIIELYEWIELCVWCRRGETFTASVYK